MSQGRKVRSQLDKVQEQSFVGRHTHDVPGDRRNPAEPGQFPVADLPRKYKLKDKEWANRNAFKQAMMDPNTGMTPFGKAVLTDRDLAALQERQRIDTAAAFDGWFGRNFNTNDLPTRLLGEELNPEYYKEREEAMVERAQMALRLELMKLYGPRSEEDLILIYGLQNRLISLDEDSLTIAPSFDRRKDQARKLQFNNAVSRFLQPDGAGINADGTGAFANILDAPQPFERGTGHTPTGRQFQTFDDMVAAFQQ